MMPIMVSIFPASSAASTDGIKAPSARPSADPTCKNEKKNLDSKEYRYGMQCNKGVPQRIRGMR